MTDPRREQSYVDSVLLGLGLGPRKPGEQIPEKFKHLSEYDIAALTEVNARKAAVYWVEGTPRTTVRFMKHDTIPTGPPIKVPPHNLKGESAQWIDDALEAEHKRGHKSAVTVRGDHPRFLPKLSRRIGSKESAGWS